MIKYKWIARDEDGDLYLFTHKPVVDENGDFYISAKDAKNYDSALEEISYSSSYPEVTFENSPQPYYPVVTKEEEDLQVGDVVRHKARPSVKMCIIQNFAESSTRLKGSSVEYFCHKAGKYVVDLVAYSSLTRWEEV